MKTIEPESESDTAALLFQLLVVCGNVMGRGPHFVVENKRHCGNLFTVLVGPTAMARKGTSFGQVEHVVTKADPGWGSRWEQGLSSGEGLVHQVRNPRVELNEHGEEIIIDHGAQDKRFLTVETEFPSDPRPMLVSTTRPECYPLPSSSSKRSRTLSPR